MNISAAFRMTLAAGAVLLALALMGLPDDAWAGKPFCGDGRCKGGETVASCPADCATDPGDVCGDGICGDTESCSSCSTDCGVCPPVACNNDGICNEGEDCNGCSDCPGRTSGNPRNRFCCGLDTCSTSQCGANACDPVPVCGNGVLEYSEECDDGNLDPGDGCDGFCVIEPMTDPVPLNQFNIGDSIGEGEAANGTIGDPNHETVWSTGYDGGDAVNALNERFESRDPIGYYENNSSRDGAFNQAISGSVMADFASQAQSVATAAQSIPDGAAGMVTVLLGNNDVCADSMAEMTDPAVFETQYRAGLDVLAGADFPDTVNLHIAGIPAIYWLWEAKRGDFWCRAFAWPFVPCQNLLDNAADDCASSASRQDPDTVFPGDGANCQRRKAFHAEIRDTYNPILSGVLAEYQSNGQLANAEFVDIFDVRFGSAHVNGGDCFHPSEAGQALLGHEHWCRSSWGQGDAACTP
ncbi:SGNH/GDSL hydrolase family protein [Elongatibacter sediminis]|uniref:SGNH/GDSL hydrolase family protein n=1 Tax=Elongatibacter sediminis TaxID=3119006 RepID=A0AAW9R6Z0_9GAMM